MSADLTELGQTPIAVVSAGVKSILDIGRTLEYLVSPQTMKPFCIFSCKHGVFMGLICVSSLSNTLQKNVLMYSLRR